MRFLFWIVPAAGHLNPSLALAEGLFGQGHEVIYYVPASWVSRVTHTGARTRLLPAHFVLPVDKVVARGGPIDFKELQRWLIAHTADMMQEVPNLLALAQQDAPDAVVYDPMCSWGQVAAKALRLPAVAFYTTFPMHPQSELFSRVVPRFDTSLSWDVARSMARLFMISERLHWRYGVPRLTPRSLFLTDEALSIVPFPREFQPDAHLFDTRYRFVGPLITPRPHYDVEPWVQSLPKERTLYISLGTMVTHRDDLYRLFYEAFGDSDWQIVLATGGRDIAAQLGPTPSNFIVRAAVPQMEVLERASLFITHCGMNSAMEAGWFGVPIVGLPQMHEQSAVAEQAVRSGLGVKLETHEVTCESLRKAVSTVGHEQRYREKAAEFKNAVRRTQGAPEAVDAILRHVKSKSVDRKKPGPS